MRLQSALRALKNRPLKLGRAPQTLDPQYCDDMAWQLLEGPTMYELVVLVVATCNCN